MAAMLTEARQGLWNAIENWAPLNGAFHRKYKFDAPGDVPAGMPLPPPGKCPAIAIFPAPSTDGWQGNITRTVDYNLTISIFTAHLVLPEVEGLWEECLRALFQCKPTGAGDLKEYWRASSHVQNMTLSQFAPQPIKCEAEKPDSPDIMRWDFLVTLKLNWNPKSPAG